MADLRKTKQALKSLRSLVLLMGSVFASLADSPGYNRSVQVGEFKQNPKMSCDVCVDKDCQTKVSSSPGNYFLEYELSIYSTLPELGDMYSATFSLKHVLTDEVKAASSLGLFDELPTSFDQAQTVVGRLVFELSSSQSSGEFYLVSSEESLDLPDQNIDLFNLGREKPLTCP